MDNEYENLIPASYLNMLKLHSMETSVAIEKHGYDIGCYANLVQLLGVLTQVALDVDAVFVSVHQKLILLRSQKSFGGNSLSNPVVLQMNINHTQES